jgi:hypothetical protein
MRKLQVECKRGHRIDDPSNVRLYRGHRTCLTCRRDRLRERRATDPIYAEKVRAQTRAHNARRRSDPTYAANRAISTGISRLHRLYGLTLEEYEAMERSQDGVCAICRKPTSYRRKDGSLGRLAVDHDHKTGRIRGLLCDQCNRMIGHLDKDPLRALGALVYLGIT